MKTIILFSVLLLSTIVTSQTKEDKINDIRMKCRIINSDSSLQKIALTNEQIITLTEEVYDGGMEIIGYYKDKSFYKIVESVGLSYGKLTTEYYSWNDNLLFVFEKQEAFPYVDSTGSFDYKRLDLSFEGRYYFDNGKLFETLTKGKKLFDDVSKVNELIEGLNSSQALLRRVF